MSIVRVNKTNNYTIMSNYHLRDRKLSLKAKPDDWDYSIAGLYQSKTTKITRKEYKQWA